ncbi:RagB/SusD family nutrient uptake outer membrane protein [Polaribacter sp. L3A8]|uniref:RagB/SusD family nutrient uptake outer membrane protein n=1 Tax=Polaribacter sp. L3A8 TaxID=2686361 RepID=UPI00131B4CEF|nr:RagB/SusD family nutrient uptake outer membrane protein [Polaribacter sp. L3A8]
MKSILIYKDMKFSIFLLLIVLGTLTSCENFLEEEVSTEISATDVYASEIGLKSGVVSLYASERNRYDKSTEDYMGSVLMSTRGDLTFSRTGYTGLIGRYERAVSPADYGSTLASTLFWKHYYDIATQATAIISAAEKVENINEASRKKIIAEAKFFRAHSYFYLYRMYGNIYVNDEPATVENAFDVISDKSSEEKIFTLLNNDLAYAVENLSWTDTFGRVTKGTAKHVKAKVAMWEGNWEEAKAQAVSLIEEGPHALVSSTAEVFVGDRNTSETLFTIQRNNELPGGGGLNMTNANYVTQYFQISGIENNNEQGGRGFSRVLPNLYLLGLLSEDPNDTRDDDTYFRLKYYYTSGDRIGEELDDYAPITDLDNPSDTYQSYYQRMHPSCIKFSQENGNPDSYLQTGNILVYRLAETYLIAAEAIMRSSGDPLPYINAIRNRANAAPLTSVDQQAILDERARELAFEGQRWFTLKRMGQSVIDYQMTTFAGDGEYFPANLGSKDPRTNWRSYFINWPIAQGDLDVLGEGYPQNDGY